MKGEFIIRIENLKFHAPIGVFDFEREHGNDFILDLEIITDDADFTSENLDSTISYAEVYQVVKEVIVREWLLLESVLKEIAERICNKWSKIRRISVKLTKINPPIPDFKGNCSVEFRKNF